MMSGTIFPHLSLNRNEIKWEDYLFEMTPVENHQGLWVKREDKFAPLGYGGVNGSKLRQLIHLIKQGSDHGATRIISGASLLSPQLSMSTVVGKHFGMETELIIGATKPETAGRHPNVQVAARMGAQFRIEPVGFNPALQRAVWREANSQPDSMVVRYGITCDIADSPGKDIVAFHELGANQVRNIPKVDELIVPAGSCNTLTSVLYGIAKYRPNIGSLYTIGIGPSKLQWVHDRLRVIEKEENIDIIPLFHRLWPQYQNLARSYDTVYDYQIDWKHYSLHDGGVYSYGDKVKEGWGGITLHPTYESKMMRWLKNERHIRQDGSQCFWIVGSAPNPIVMEPFYTLPVQDTVEVV